MNRHGVSVFNLTTKWFTLRMGEFQLCAKNNCLKRVQTFGEIVGITQIHERFFDVTRMSQNTRESSALFSNYTVNYTLA